MNGFKNFMCLTLFIVGGLFSLHSHAAGMVPETSLLMINEAEEGGSINIKNTDESAGLLYTSIVDLPDDKGVHLIVTQPVVRVDAGQTQHIRFILQTQQPLQTEHLKRVHFEGIPQRMPGKNKVGFNIRQDLPVLIHPAGLPIVKDAWTLLNWNLSGDTLTVKNPSAYVVRMTPQCELLPSHTRYQLEKNYILPGQTLTVSGGAGAGGNTHVTFMPVSRYGIQVESVTAPLNHR
jgi:P pilus assembly chaperone PapD